MKLKKVFLCAITVSLFSLSLSLGTFASTGQSWYCKRTSDHSQPPVGSDIAYVEECDGYYIDKKHSDQNDEKVVYLTFDAGYENGNVERILDTLANKDVKGAFFVLGHLIECNTQLVKRMQNEGHLVCNHTYSHKCMVGKTKEEFAEELGKLEKCCLEYTGREISKYYRPPEGRFDRKGLECAQEMGYSTVFWSFAYADWDNNRQMSDEAALKKILDNIHNGAVLLLHPTSKTNANIMSRLIDTLQEQGYRFGTLDELCVK